TQLFVVPADGGTPRQLTSGPYNHDGRLSWSRDGRTLYFSANRSDDWQYDPLESELWSVDVASANLQALTDRDGPDYAPAVSPDGRRIAWLGFDDRKLGYQNTRVYVMNTDGSGRRAVNSDFDRSVDEVQWAGSGRLYIQYDDHGRTRLASLGLDGKLAVLLDDIGGASIGRPYTSGGFSASGNGRFAYSRDSAQRPADVAVGNVRGDVRQLTALNEDLLAQRTLGEVEPVSWSSSADGLAIDGWLIKPPDFDPGRKYPLLLEIHGGPFAAYGPHFSAELQLYAAAGYVVLYANPRGSTSYGADFANEIHHAYPGEDYDDLMSGVDAVLGRGYIDSDQLFVTGGSGGGVLTAWIVGKTGRFAAAASVKPVINWTSMVLTSDISTFVPRYWFADMPWEDPDAYWRRSPLSLVGNVTTPTMLMTGEQDYRTPISEAEQFYQALQLRRIDTALVRVPEAPHGIAGRPSHLIAKVDNILAWFGRYRTAGGGTP
ncbi:MAG TPA: S9 family peptidase, partial [Woeseiaceae bacterium]|nr:S9 family peptidase [Woeseiaceae bacterium]